MAVASLTQAEAQQRAAMIEVTRYDIAVDLTELPTGPAVRCRSTITFTCRRPGTQTFVDCAAQVLSAELNGRELGPPHEGRIELTGLAERNVLRVASVQVDTSDGEGVHKAVDAADGEVYVWTSFEPDEARHVWACFDQPDLKAPHAFTVTAPSGWTVTSCSGDPVVEDIDDVEGALEPARRWSFADTPPLSTYNVVVNAGPFHEIRRATATHDLGLYTRRSLTAVAERDADEVFRLTEQGLTFFADAFGMPFPQRTYNQVFMPEYPGAMENYGCVTWSDSILTRTAPTPAEREDFAKTLLHEMAHMWFGNVVTMRWWDDLWLNESFAELACNWAAVRATEYTDAWAGQLADQELRAYLADQGPTSHPIRQPIRDVTQAVSIFDAITYPKGSAALRQLMAFVGEDGFRSGMRAYFAQHAWGNTTLADLIDALATAVGRDLGPWRDGWLGTAGTDQLTLEPDGDGYVLVTSEGPTEGSARPHVLRIGAYRRGPVGLTRTQLVDVRTEGPRTPVALPPDQHVYLLNDDNLTFATTRARVTGSHSLFDLAADLPTPLARAVAVSELWDMLVTGEAAADEAVRCLTAVLATETAPSVIEPYLNLAADIAEKWAPETQRRELLAAVAATCRDLALDPHGRVVALRTLARTAADPDELSWVRDQAGQDVDLQWRALVRLAELGGDPAGNSADLAEQVAGLRDRDPDPDAWVRALTVRAALPNAASKDEVWQLIAVRRTVPVGMLRAVTTAFWRPGQDDVLAPYPGRYLEVLPDLKHGSMLTAMGLTSRLFPVFAVDAEYLGRVRTAAADTAPVILKTVLEQADIVARMLRTRR